MDSPVSAELVDETADVSRAVTEEIVDEGIVLLENKDNTLPLATTDVNVFGYSSAQIVYGGSGSGASDEEVNVGLREAMASAGFNMNEELAEFYEENIVDKEEIDIFDLFGNDYNMYEHPVSMYDDDMIERAKDFSDVAIVVLSRNGGEGGDLAMDMEGYLNGDAGRHYLELAQVEEDLLDMVRENFGTMIVVLNTSNTMELGFLEDYDVEGALWIGNPGSTGLNSLAKVLAGDVNPSGRLVDTYAYDVTTAPAYYNAGDFDYLNSEHEEISEMAGISFGATNDNYKFVDYAEGIYVGYRFYETRWVDNETGEMDEVAYHEMVQYPFGYGISYTEFEQEITGFKADDKTIEIEVEVTNTGDTAGKEVVQIYYTAPYTPGGIEKSHVALAGFEKTAMLEPGASETLTVELAVEDMASYDYADAGAYVLEAGDYEIKLMENAHDVIDSEIYTVEETIVYDGDNKRESDETAAVNQFDDAHDDGLGETVYVSRADWEGTLPTERTPDREISDEVMTALADTSVEVDEDAEPIVHADHGLTLADMRGLDYDDPLWDDLLEQVPVSEMVEMLRFGGYTTMQMSSVDKPRAVDIDGPAGVNGLVSGIIGVQFPNEVVIASTWNVELTERMGEVFAEEAAANRASGLYAPGANIHRTPFAGRNFEYYSEDPYISGVMAASMTKGVNSKGGYVFAKHFALNDQETNRTGVATWSNEQAIREIYLKPFEMAVKDGGATGMMSAYNRIGTTWSGANSSLLEDVLRGEWGFQGTVITDMFQGGYMVADQAIANGNDLMLTPMGTSFTEEITETNWGQQKMREATKNVLYTVANSSAFDIAYQGIPLYMYIYILVNIVILGLIGFGYFKATNSKKVAAKKAMKITKE